MKTRLSAFADSGGKTAETAVEKACREVSTLPAASEILATGIEFMFRM
jgi:hypothetical protein